MNFKYAFAKIACSVLPPILSQRVRNLIIDKKLGVNLSRNFIRRSFTGAKLRGNTSDFHAFKFSVHGFFDWRNVVIAGQAVKNSPGAIIEVGANIGTETISYGDIGRRFGQRVIAFEPLPANYSILSENIAYNKFDNVSLSNNAVSDSAGSVTFQSPSVLDSGSGFITSDLGTDTITVKTTTLDFECKDISVSLLAIDVEGLEYRVLKGAETIIAEQRPVIIVEVNENFLQPRAGIDLAEFNEFFQSREYTCFYVEKLGLEAVDIANFKVKPNKNWVCIPNENSALKNKISNAILINGCNPFFNFWHFV